MQKSENCMKSNEYSFETDGLVDILSDSRSNLED